MDPVRFPNPEKFNPDRYMENQAEEMIYGHNAFGKGRRLCAGKGV